MRHCPDQKILIFNSLELSIKPAAGNFSPTEKTVTQKERCVGCFRNWVRLVVKAKELCGDVISSQRAIVAGEFSMNRAKFGKRCEGADRIVQATLTERPDKDFQVVGTDIVIGIDKAKEFSGRDIFGNPVESRVSGR